MLTREEMEQVINEGGSISLRGDIYSTIASLPSQEELTEIEKAQADALKAAREYWDPGYSARAARHRSSEHDPVPPPVAAESAPEEPAGNAAPPRNPGARR